MKEAVLAYVDTSIFGGAEDEDFREATLKLLRRVKRGEYLLLVSEVTMRELADAPPKVRQVLTDLPSDRVTHVSGDVEEEAGHLAEAYIAAGVLGPARHDDASHVAIATVARAGLILSWNFRHIVNYAKIHEFNRINALHGYPPVDIRSPLEVIYGDEDES
jgi:hypothetical protein